MPSPSDNTAQRSAETSPATLSDVSRQTLDALSVANQRRQLRSADPSGKHIALDGMTLLNLASNDYLALSQDPKLIAAAVEATRQYGVGAGASRLVSGTQSIHQEVEERFASFKHAEASLLLPTGYTANLAVLTTLAGAGDLFVMDKLVHASLIDAARASGADVRTYPHLQLERAEVLLKRHTTGRRFLVTDSVFSMDGDCADLPSMCDLADRRDASLIVDEAHGTGVLGADGSGLAMSQGVAERIYRCGSSGVVISTASKALGSLGGLITADQAIIDLLINKARPFIYSTAVPPAQVATIDASLDLVRDEPNRRQQLSQHAAKLRGFIECMGFATVETTQPTPIIPVIVGDEAAALQAQAQFLTAGVFAPAIRPPTVAPGQCRLRLSLRSDFEANDLDQIRQALQLIRV